MGNFKGGPIRGLYNSATDVSSKYPRSAKLLPSIFQDIIRGSYSSLNARKEDPGALDPKAVVENEIDWDPFTIRFDWTVGGNSHPQLKKTITNFIHNLKVIQTVMPNSEKVPLAELDLDGWGGSIAFTHPDHALLLLRKVIAWETNGVNATTDGAKPRNIFNQYACTKEGDFKKAPANDGAKPPNEDFCTEEKDFAKAAECFQYYAKNELLSLDDPNSLLKHLPAAPYASREAAFAMAGIVNAKKEVGRTIIDIAELENAIAVDCNRKVIPCPHRVPH